jgi:hypothetical protein
VKTVVIEVCGSMLIDVYSDDPVFVLLVDWDSEGYEPGDCYVCRVKDGDQERLVLGVPGYPITPLARMPEATRKAVEQVALGLLTPAAGADTDGKMPEEQ